MKSLAILLAAVTAFTFTTTSALAAEITKETAIQQALAAHPGSVEKAYQETKKGVPVWEIKVKGEDGNTWKAYYRVDGGELFMKKKNDKVVKESTS